MTCTEWLFPPSNQDEAGDDYSEDSEEEGGADYADSGSGASNGSGAANGSDYSSASHSSVRSFHVEVQTSQGSDYSANGTDNKKANDYSAPGADYLVKGADYSASGADNKKGEDYSNSQRYSRNKSGKCLSIEIGTYGSLSVYP